MGQFILNGRNYSGLTYANGCFIDTDNLITSGQYTGTLSYTATEDCFVVVDIATDSNTDTHIEIDGVAVNGIYRTGGNTTDVTFLVPLKKGQTLSVVNGNVWACSYHVYGIQEGSPVTFLSEYASACYDTNEREVGCWIDGKPIYQKTTHIGAISANATSAFSVGVGANVVDTMVSYSVIAYVSSGAWVNLPQPLPSNISSYASYVDNYNKANDTINIITGADRDFSDAFVTVRYTKTTDVAGSGKLTPTAMPTVHYDDTERIIGTWFGETLYEKVISLTSGITIGSYGHISLPANSIVRGLEGYAYRSNHAVVDKFNGYIASGELFASIRSGQIEYWISNIFDPVEEITFTIQYTKTS